MTSSHSSYVSAVFNYLSSLYRVLAGHEEFTDKPNQSYSQEIPSDELDIWEYQCLKQPKCIHRQMEGAPNSTKKIRGCF